MWQGHPPCAVGEHSFAIETSMVRTYTAAGFVQRNMLIGTHDVLDPAYFSPLLFNKPDAAERAGSGKLDRLDKWSFCRKAA
ncbi:hypothetical protein [Methylocella sp.]|jgi:hypothetical protein